MKKIALVMAAVLALGAGATAYAAGFNTMSENRGIDKCRNDMARHYQGVVHSQKFFMAKSQSQMRFYFNSQSYVDNDWVNLATKCVSSSNGQDVLSRETLTGSWEAPRGKVTIEVASN